MIQPMDDLVSTKSVHDSTPINKRAKSVQKAQKTMGTLKINILYMSLKRK